MSGKFENDNERFSNTCFVSRKQDGDSHEFKSEFLITLEERGFIKDVTDREGLDREILSKGKDFAGYIGFDATAPSLHAGSLFMLMMLRHLVKCGHKAVVIIGGTTTRFGDPTGKDKSRPKLDTETIEKNSAGIEKVIREIIPEAEIINNNAWFDGMDFVEFFTEIGDKFSINDMVTKDVVKSRLEGKNHMSFKEFSYMLMQGFDFMKLNELKGVTLQMGGSDQWSNVLSGIELTRKKASVQLFGLTSHLLKESGTGKKMGKSSDGKTIWLDEEITNSFDFWQFWRNTRDEDVEKFLKIFTDKSLVEINELMKSNINDAKIALADDVTAFVHDEDKAKEAKEAAHSLFNDENSNNIEGLPRVVIKEVEIGLINALVVTGLCSSKSDARRKINEGAVKIDGEKISDWKFRLSNGSLTSGVKLSRGKKNHCVIISEN